MKVKSMSLVKNTLAAALLAGAFTLSLAQAPAAPKAPGAPASATMDAPANVAPKPKHHAKKKVVKHKAKRHVKKAKSAAKMAPAPAVK